MFTCRVVRAPLVLSLPDLVRQQTARGIVRKASGLCKTTAPPSQGPLCMGKRKRAQCVS